MTKTPLPEIVRQTVEDSPVEDIALYIVRQALPGVLVQSAINMTQTFPFVLVRRADEFGQWDGDVRFVDAAGLLVDTFAENPNGDEDAALLGNAVKVCLRDAWLNQVVVPGRGWLTSFEVFSAPRRVTDWATGVGPVQFADLPHGVERYQAAYHLRIRKPRTLSL